VVAVIGMYRDVPSTGCVCRRVDAVDMDNSDRLPTNQPRGYLIREQRGEVVENREYCR
jgi:hypothetical protein